MKRAISGLNEGIVLGLTKGFRGFGAEADAEADAAAGAASVLFFGTSAAAAAVGSLLSPGIKG